MRSSYLRSLALPFFCWPLALELTQSSSDAMLRWRFTCCLVSVCRRGIPDQCIINNTSASTTPKGKKPLSCLLNNSARDFQTMGCAVAGDPIVMQPRLYKPGQHIPATCNSAQSLAMSHSTCPKSTEGRCLCVATSRRLALALSHSE